MQFLQWFRLEINFFDTKEKAVEEALSVIQANHTRR